MKKASLLLAAVLSGQTLDTAGLGDNTWVDHSPANLSINGSNWTYENDLKSDPLSGLFILGPGHVIHPQDCNYYPFDPVKNKWFKANPPTRVTRQCMSTFAVNSQDSVIIQIAGAEMSHQLSQGGFAADYKSILQDQARGSALWAYSLNRNEWYHMKGPVNLPGLCCMRSAQYLPDNDVLISSTGGETYAYHFHTNTAVSIGTGAPNFQNSNFSASVDTRRGLLYVMDAGGLWSFNPNSGVWGKAPGSAPSYPSNGVGLNMTAYDELNDVIVYIGDDVDGAPNLNTWVFDCAALTWAKMNPAVAPRDRGRLAYNKALNTFLLLGGTASGGISRGGSTQGIWFYRYKRGPGSNSGLAAAPVATITTQGAQVNLAWTSVNESGVSGYNVFRAAANPFPKNFAKLNASPVAGTTYADPSAVAGTSYSYRVCAVKNGSEGHLSRHLYTKPGRVLNTVASVEDSGVVKVSWDGNPEPDIVGYNIYRARADAIYTAPLASSYTKLNNTPVSAVQYVDNVDLRDRVARGYVVTAVNAFGLESGTSQECTTFPNPPEFAYTIPVGGKMRMGWQPPKGTKILGVNFYRVHGSLENSTGPLTDTLTNGWDLPPVTADDGYSLMGKTYVVRAVNMLGQEGFMTDQISPSNNDYGPGIAPASIRFDYGQYAKPSAVEAASRAMGGALNPVSLSPNPFNPQLTVGYRLDRAGVVEIRIYDVAGRNLKSFKTLKSAGGYSQTFKLTGFPSGVYVARVAIDGRTYEKKAMLVK